jgi:hypothetical protein
MAKLESVNLSELGSGKLGTDELAHLQAVAPDPNIEGAMEAVQELLD